MTIKGTPLGLNIGIEHAKRGMVILSPAGSIDSQTCELLDKQIKKVVKRSVTTVVLDMTGVDFITSRGVGLIAETKASLTQKQIDLAIFNLQPQVRKVFEIMCLLPALNVFADRDELDDYLGKVQRKITEDEIQT
jgi:anti-anti-sigma factor